MNADIYVALGETSSPEGLDVEDAGLRLPRNFHSSVLGHSCSATAGSSHQRSNTRIWTPLAVTDLSWLQLYLSSFHSL